MGSPRDVGNSGDPTFLVLGLGNPGEEYAGTRHNFGFLVVDAIVREERLSFARGPGPVRSASIRIGAERGILAKPTTFMNRSGDAARALRTAHSLLPFDRWLVITDDLDLPFGRLRLRASGGAGGHNGLRSVIDALGTNEFPRLRVGIGRPNIADRDEVVDWVLERFTREEEELLPGIVRRATDSVRAFVSEGLSAAMNRTNAAGSTSPGIEGTPA